MALNLHPITLASDGGQSDVVMTYSPDAGLQITRGGVALLTLDNSGNLMIAGSSGSVGVDRSANAPAGPGAATSFAFNGTTVNLLTTIPVNPARKALEINNTTGAQIVVVIDDGNNTAGSVSLFPIDAGAAAYRQGGDLGAVVETGRFRVFGAAGTFCYAREN